MRSFEKSMFKDKSMVGMIFDHSRLHCSEWCVVFFSIFFSFLCDSKYFYLQNS